MPSSPEEALLLDLGLPASGEGPHRSETQSMFTKPVPEPSGLSDAPVPFSALSPAPPFMDVTLGQPSGSRTIGCMRDLMIRPSVMEVLAGEDGRSSADSLPAVSPVTPDAKIVRSQRPSTPPTTGSDGPEDGNRVEQSVLTLGCVRDLVDQCARWQNADHRRGDADAALRGPSPPHAQAVDADTREFLEALQQSGGTQAATLDAWSLTAAQQHGNTIGVGSRDLRPNVGQIFDEEEPPQLHAAPIELSAEDPAPALMDGFGPSSDSEGSSEDPLEWVGCGPDDDGATAQPPLPLPPCTHNDWDNVRVKKGQFGLRCRQCYAPWKVPAAHATRSKCPVFFRMGLCPQGINCPLPHIHRFKRQAKEADKLRAAAGAADPQAAPAAAPEMPGLSAEPQAVSEKEHMEATFAVPGVQQDQELSEEALRVLQETVQERVGNEAFIEAMATRPCAHNNWDNVRMVKGRIGLRCRNCNKHWKPEVAAVVKCPAFFSGFCPNGVRCPLPHIHRYKNKQKEIAKARNMLEGGGAEDAAAEKPATPSADGSLEKLQLMRSLHEGRVLGDSELARLTGMAQPLPTPQQPAPAADTADSGAGRGRGRRVRKQPATPQQPPPQQPVQRAPGQQRTQHPPLHQAVGVPQPAQQPHLQHQFMQHLQQQQQQQQQQPAPHLQQQQYMQPPYLQQQQQLPLHLAQSLWQQQLLLAASACGANGAAPPMTFAQPTESDIRGLASGQNPQMFGGLGVMPHR
eukprot:TRINITY_DN566_c0_g1_i1.p1 TRINITY_DN566_c0_g1~~TRINITY_DN566_c0_g1_i1.p1  ORF type:complete len:771 (+),score=213.58 TRINITY_DN566_c0_g1_i1:90-2315(+)